MTSTNSIINTQRINTDKRSINITKINERKEINEVLMNILKYPIKFFSSVGKVIDFTHDKMSKTHSMFRIADEFWRTTFGAGKGIAPHEFTARAHDQCAEIVSSPSSSTQATLDCINRFEDMECNQIKQFNFIPPQDTSILGWSPTNKDTEAILNAARYAENSIKSKYEKLRNVDFRSDSALAVGLVDAGVVSQGKYKPHNAQCR